MTKPNILVVEDDDQIAFFIRHVLEREGFRVRHAADGRQAEAMIGEPPAPDVITLDLDLPHASGDQLMLKIKTTPGWERIPVVMVTATPRSDDSTWAVKKGAREYLVKPFKPEDLVACLRRLTKAKKPA